MSTDSEHYAIRERQERALAARVDDPRIAAIHIAMADQYDTLAREERDAGGSEPAAMLSPGGEARTLIG